MLKLETDFFPVYTNFAVMLIGNFFLIVILMI